MNDTLKRNAEITHRYTGACLKDYGREYNKNTDIFQYFSTLGYMKLLHYDNIN
jgi:hypothetical protein